VLALRVTYVGELGFEFTYVEFAVSVYDALMARGQEHGIANAATAPLSLYDGKGLPVWGADIGQTILHCRWPCWATKLKSNMPFQRTRGAGSAGRKAAARCCGIYRRSVRRAPGPRDYLSRRQARRLAHDGGYGYTVGRSIRLRLYPRSGRRRRETVLSAATSSRSPRRAYRGGIPRAAPTTHRRASRADRTHSAEFLSGKGRREI
jgi:glycine cleavage system aminomethyltransferase T